MVIHLTGGTGTASRRFLRCAQLPLLCILLSISEEGTIVATTMFFEETVKDQGNVSSMDIEIGRSSFYPEDSVYIIVDGKTVIMDLATAKRFVNAVADVGRYHRILEEYS